VAKRVKGYKVDERYFCLPVGAGAKLPAWVREGVKGTGYKTYNAFFAVAGYYRVKHYERLDSMTPVGED